ncbi:MAG: NAD(+) synthase [Ezakiella sp.]|nr:NAD(+) synthase [Ezakiella sp.]MDD7472069.1 NAD(+) synthase [Bacillota bacterium]MDY3924033.1 NAD(+) synthase [Ezakiella sp.]
MKNPKIEIKRIQNFLMDTIRNTGTDGYVLGISGGLDSSVLFKIIDGLPIKFIAVKMPIHSIREDEFDADTLVKDAKADILRIDLTKIYDDMLALMPDSGNNLANSNLKPRLRMSTLYHIAQTNNLLVIGATNKSEYLTGYFTKYGDSGVDVMPLREYLKFEIYEMARVLSVPDSILNKPPSAGLFKGQTDEEEMGIRYKDLDAYLCGQNVDEKTKNIAENMLLKTNHKRNIPIFYKREEE